MTDSDWTPFEVRLAARLRSHSAIMVTPIDGVVVTAASLSAGRSWRLRRLWSPPTRVLLLVAVALLVAAGIAAGAIVGGGWTHRGPMLPSPTAPARSLPAAVLLSPTGRLALGPRSSTLTTLADGRVLLVGGGGSTAELYDPATNRFAQTGGLSGGVESPAAIRLLDGRVLVVGHGSAIGSPSADVYDPLSARFGPTGEMLFARQACGCASSIHVTGTDYRRFNGWEFPKAALLSDGRVVIAGGLQSPEAEIYEPLSNAFTVIETGCDSSRSTLASLPDGGALMTCYLDGVNEAWRLDPATHSFSATGPPSTTDGYAATTLLDGRVLLTGDSVGGNANPAEIYDPASRSFQPLADGTNPRTAARVVLQDGRVFFLAAQVGALLFDPATLSFRNVLPGHFEQSTSWALALLADGRILVLGDDPTGTIIDPRLL